MDLESSYAYEIEEFINNFDEFRTKKIVLYGTGRMTTTLLEHIKGFQIIGLADRIETEVGNYKYGIKIMDQQEVEKEADMVIINTAEQYWGDIYNRIKMWKIPIYTRSGRLLSEDSVRGKIAESYFEKNPEALSRKIQMNEVISFDIFDTLIMRKICKTEDVFKLVELSMQHELDEQFSYVEIRRKAEQLLDEPNIDEIYDVMGELTGWTTDLLQRLKQKELQVDRELIIPRQKMVDLCNAAMESKAVYFISDMYYPSDILFDMLQEHGIHIQDKNKVIVSCDYKISKQNGKLWDYYHREIVAGRSALHIGDNLISDGNKPKEYGIDTYTILSAFDMLQCASLYRIVPLIKDIQESLHFGIVLAKVFNNPFALYNSKGRISLTTDVDAGYCLLGGLIYSFFKWLICTAKEDDIHQLIFLGRDGYLLIRVYEYICEQLNISLPKGKYLEASRRAVMVAALKTEEDICRLSKVSAYRGNAKEFLLDRFGLETADENLMQTTLRDMDDIENILPYIMERYANKILERAKMERNAYKAYMKSLDIQEKFAFVDTGHFGKIQYSIGKILEKETIGYYFSAAVDNRNIYYANNMKGCFQAKEDKMGFAAEVYKKVYFIESVFTAPNGMLLYVDESGERIYDKLQHNQKHFDIRWRLLEGMLAYCSDMIELEQHIGLDSCIPNPVSMDKIFGIMYEECDYITKDKKEGFSFNDSFLERIENRLS